MNGKGKPRDVMKAYTVQVDDPYEFGCCLVFASSDIAARRKGAPELGCDEIGGLTCKRAKWADEYAPGPVPILVMIDNGWSFECGECCEHVDIYTEAPIEIDGWAYCSQRCLDRSRHCKRMSKRLRAKARAIFERRLQREFPGAEVDGKTHVYASTYNEGRGWIVSQVIVNFRFPGCAVGPATYRFDNRRPGQRADPQAYVCKGDLAAWDAWRAKAKTEVVA